MSHFRSLPRRQGEGHSFLLMQSITGCVHGARRKHVMQTVLIEQNSAKLATFMTSEYEGRSLKCCFGPLMIGISKRNFVYVCSTCGCTRIRKKKKPAKLWISRAVPDLKRTLSPYFRNLPLLHITIRLHLTSRLLKFMQWLARKQYVLVVGNAI